MRVLVTADTLGGVWTYARELVTGLVKRGVQVTLVSFGEIPSPAQMTWLEAAPGVDFHPTAFRLEWMQDCEPDLRASSGFLQQVISEVRPDLLHFNQYCYGALETDLPKLVVAHSDVVSWWVAVHGHEPPASRWIQDYRRVASAGLRGATHLAAPSRWMLERIGLHYAEPASASVIYNGRSPSLFNPHVSKDDYVLSVGRLWDCGKQVTLLAQAEPPMSVYIVGSQEHPEESLRASTVVSGRGRLHLKGPQSDVQLRQLYSRASIYAATSRYEPFGLAPLEAALSRCALVANDIPTFREVWGDAALFFPRNDAGALELCLQRLHRDRELRLTYAGLAYRRAVERYSAARMVDEYIALYQALVPAEVVAA